MAASKRSDFGDLVKGMLLREFKRTMGLLAALFLIGGWWPLVVGLRTTGATRSGDLGMAAILFVLGAMLAAVWWLIRRWERRQRRDSGVLK